MLTFKPSAQLAQENLDRALVCGVDLLHILHMDLERFRTFCSERVSRVIVMHAHHAQVSLSLTRTIVRDCRFVDDMFDDICEALFIVRGQNEDIVHKHAVEFLVWAQSIVGGDTFGDDSVIVDFRATIDSVTAHVRIPDLASVADMRAGSPTLN